MERKLHQVNFSDTLTTDLGERRTAAFFDTCDQMILWNSLAEPLPDMYYNHTNNGKK